MSECNVYREDGTLVPTTYVKAPQCIVDLLSLGVWVPGHVVRNAIMAVCPSAVLPRIEWPSGFDVWHDRVSDGFKVVK